MIARIVKNGMLLLALWAMNGCTMDSGRYGSIVLDQEAERDFETFRIDPQMNYYYSGPDLYPNALIGLKKEYVLDNDLWKILEPDPKIFKEKIRSMQEMARMHSTFHRGFAIKDPRGKQIGAWYSILGIKTMIVKMGQGNQVIVYTPEMEIYGPRDAGSGG